MKKKLFALAALSALCATAAFGGTTLKLGTTMAANAVIPHELSEMSKRVAARTNGGVVIEVYPDSLLGKESEMYESLFMGTLDIAIETLGFQSTHHPELAIEDLPYMFKTREDGYRAIDGAYGEKLKEIIGASGEIRCLGFLEMGLRQMTNNVRPIVRPEDIKGIKIRTTQSRLRIDVFNSLGALPISMGLSEVFTALQQGVVDGQESPVNNIWDCSYYDVQKYLSLTGHFWCNECFLINEESWRKLSDDERKVILDELAVASKNVRERQVAEEADLLKKMEAKGVKVNEVDKEAFKKVLEPLYDKWEKSTFGKELMDAYREYSGY